VLQRNRVLIIDDDEEIRRSLGEVLREQGHEVDLAAHGQDALTQLRSGIRPSLIILDLMMPVMDGWRFRSNLVDDPELSEIPIIVLTGVGDHWGLPEGTSVHLRKPFDLKRLLREVERCVS
jgi:CheY-like chemotaxis protein